MVTLGLGIGAEDSEQPVGERGPRTPSLLSTQNIVVPVPPGRRSDRRHVAAGVRLRPALCPDFLARSHLGQVACFLLFGPELHQRRAEQKDPVLVHAPGSTGAVIFFLEDQPLDQVRSAASVLDRPRNHRPPALVEGALPLPVSLKALGGIHRWKRLTRNVLLEPLARLAAEGFFLFGVCQLHRVQPDAPRARGRPARAPAAPWNTSSIRASLIVLFSCPRTSPLVSRRTHRGLPVNPVRCTVRG